MTNPITTDPNLTPPPPSSKLAVKIGLDPVVVGVVVAVLALLKCIFKYAIHDAN
jgi:hypothetical protein